MQRVLIVNLFIFSGYFQEMFVIIYIKHFIKKMKINGLVTTDVAVVLETNTSMRVVTIKRLFFPIWSSIYIFSQNFGQRRMLILRLSANNIVVVLNEQNLPQKSHT